MPGHSSGVGHSDNRKLSRMRATISLGQAARFLDMIVHGYGRAWKVEDDEGLGEVIAWRNSRGGGIFWMAHEGDDYPLLEIRISGDVADVHFFPKEGHPGFRCLGGWGLPVDGSTKLVYQGCDPGDGEEIPNRFIIPLATARRVAREFLARKRMSDAVSWFEL